MTDQEARELGIEAALRQVAIELEPTPKTSRRAPTSSASTSRLVPRRRGWSTRGCSSGCGRARSSSTPRAAEVVDSRSARPTPCATGGCASASTSSPNEPSGATGDVRRSARRAAGRLRHAPHRRVDRAGAGGDRRGDGPHRRHLQGDRPRAERRQPRAARRRRPTCWSSATATGPACSPTSSTQLRQADLNVQETENIVFEGAEAAVARINLDGEPVGRAVRIGSKPATTTSSIYKWYVCRAISVSIGDQKDPWERTTAAVTLTYCFLTADS